MHWFRKSKGRVLPTLVGDYGLVFTPQVRVFFVWLDVGNPHWDYCVSYSRLKEWRKGR